MRNEKTTISTRNNNVASLVQGLTLRDDLYSARDKLILLYEDI
jgi:hypothetical protein